MLKHTYKRLLWSTPLPIDFQCSKTTPRDFYCSST